MKKICLIISLTLALLNAEEYAGSLLKKGVYKSLGYMSGYHRYAEVDTSDNNAFVMSMDMLTFGLVGQLGAVSASGIKVEGTLRANYALGLYTGGFLNQDGDADTGKRVYTMVGSFNADAEVKSGYNFLRSFESASLYLQSGLGYYFASTQFITMERLQGYLYVPLELEGEVLLNDKVALNYGGGYKFLIFGNHYSATSKYGLEGDMDVMQRKGFGAGGFIGAQFRTKSGGLRNVRLIYEYWSIENSPLTQLYSSDINSTTKQPTHRYYLEPKNSTHRVFLQYSFLF